MRSKLYTLPACLSLSLLSLTPLASAQDSASTSPSAASSYVIEASHAYRGHSLVVDRNALQVAANAICSELAAGELASHFTYELWSASELVQASSRRFVTLLPQLDKYQYTGKSRVGAILDANVLTSEGETSFVALQLNDGTWFYPVLNAEGSVSRLYRLSELQCSTPASEPPVSEAPASEPVSEAPADAVSEPAVLEDPVPVTTTGETGEATPVQADAHALMAPAAADDAAAQRLANFLQEFEERMPESSCLPFTPTGRRFKQYNKVLTVLKEAANFSAQVGSEPKSRFARFCVAISSQDPAATAQTLQNFMKSYYRQDVDFASLDLNHKAFRKAEMTEKASGFDYLRLHPQPYNAMLALFK